MRIPSPIVAGLWCLAVLHGPAAGRAAEIDWSGWWVGAHAGIGAVRSQGAWAGLPGGDLGFGAGTPRFSTAVPFAATSNGEPFLPWPSATTLDGGRFAAGLSAGRDWQYDRFVVGFAADASLFADPGSERTWSVRETFTTGATGSGIRTTSFARSDAVDWLVTLRPRIGFTFGRLLLFADAGVALGGVTTSTSADLDEQWSDGASSHAARAMWSGRRSDVRVGPAVGAGARWAVDEHLSIRAEGTWFDLRDRRTTASGSGFWVENGGAATAMGAAAYSVKSRIDGAFMRLGVDWRF
jgi:outer membrane immunogenic protein